MLTHQTSLVRPFLDFESHGAVLDVQSHALDLPFGVEVAGCACGGGVAFAS